MVGKRRSRPRRRGHCARVRARRGGRTLRDLLGVVSRAPRRVAVDVLLAVGSLAAAHVLSPFLGRVLGIEGDVARVVGPSGPAQIAAWILVSLAAGAGEEISFRGYLQGQFAGMMFSKIVSPSPVSRAPVTLNADGPLAPRQGLGPPRREEAADGADAALRRPPPRPRGHEPAGVRDAEEKGWRVAFPSRTVATVDHIVPTASVARPFADPAAEEMLVALQRNARGAGIELLDLGAPGQGIVHVIGPGARPHAARDDDRVRRQPHVHARRVRRARVRDRDVAGARRPRVAVPRDGPMKVRRIDVAGRLAPGRLREGRDPHDHPDARRQGRRRLRVRVRRRGRLGDVDGRADDALQHVDRGRRARGLREPGRR